MTVKDWEYEPGKHRMFAVIPTWRMVDIPHQMRVFNQKMGTVKIDVFMDYEEAEKFSKTMLAPNHIVELVSVAEKTNPAPQISYFNKTKPEEFFFFGAPEGTQRVEPRTPVESPLPEPSPT